MTYLITRLGKIRLQDKILVFLWRLGELQRFNKTAFPRAFENIEKLKNFEVIHFQIDPNFPKIEKLKLFVHVMDMNILCILFIIYMLQITI